MLNIQQFDDQAKAVLAEAYRVSQRYAHGMVDSPHLLTALLEQTQSRIPVILDQLSVDRTALLARLDELLRALPTTAGQSANLKQVFITPTAKRALHHAADAAGQLETEVVAPEHLLLALLHEPDAAFSGVLADFDITYDRVLSVVRSP